MEAAASSPRRSVTRRRLALIVGGLAVLLRLGLLVPADQRVTLQPALGNGNGITMLLRPALRV